MKSNICLIYSTAPIPLALSSSMGIPIGKYFMYLSLLPQHHSPDSSTIRQQSAMPYTIDPTLFFSKYSENTPNKRSFFESAILVGL